MDEGAAEKSQDDAAEPNPPAPPAEPQARAASDGPSLMRLPWLGAALILVAVVGVIAKVLGVLVLPGMAGITTQRAVDTADLLSSTFAYSFALLCVLVIGAGAYELSATRGVGLVSRIAGIGLSALVVAFALPSITHRLQLFPTLGLMVVTILLTITAAVNALRSAATRVLGAVLALFALGALVRPASWELTMIAGEQASIGLYGVGRTLAAIALVLSALSTLLAAAWLGTRSRVRGRLLANGAIVAAFLLTYIAARDAGDSSTFQMVLRSSLAQSNGLPLPYVLTSIGEFLVPATVLLALVSVVQRAAAPTVLASLALALLSQGAFDVPLQALAMAAAAHWAMLASGDPRSLWAAMTATHSKKPQSRLGV